MIVRQFLQWVRAARPGERAEATSALARAYLHSDLSTDDLAAAEGAMIMLLDDPSPLVRQAMSDVFASSQKAPPVVVRALADDQFEVAQPLIERSPLLCDEDLVELVAAGKPQTLNETYNVVSEHTWTWDEVTQKTAAALGFPPPKIVHIPSDLLVSIDPARYGGMNDIFRYHGVYSNAKLHRDLPEYREITPFDAAVRETVAWMGKNNRLKKAEEDPFESKLIEMYEAFCKTAREALAPKKSS